MKRLLILVLSFVITLLLVMPVMAGKPDKPPRPTPSPIVTPTPIVTPEPTPTPIPLPTPVFNPTLEVINTDPAFFRTGTDLIIKGRGFLAFTTYDILFHVDHISPTGELQSYDFSGTVTSDVGGKWSFFMKPFFSGDYTAQSAGAVVSWHVYYSGVYGE